MQVNTSAVQLWVKALRSNNYPQGKGWLNQNGKFCVWGVACEVAITNRQDVERSKVRSPKSVICLYNSCGTFAPNPVLTWIGIGSQHNVASPFGPNTLMALSDRGVPFVLLADIIESNYIKGTAK